MRLGRTVLFEKKVVAGECYEALGPLLIRYQIIETPWFGVFIHHFMRSDADRDLHDHPWPFISWLVSGGYYEWHQESPAAPRERFWRRRWSVLFRPAEWIHAVSIDRPVWTVVLIGKNWREWGFWTPEGWIHVRKYGYRKDC